MRFPGLAAAAACAAVLSGCASIVTGQQQSIHITTPPADGAACTLTNSRGTWYVRSPGSAWVKKSWSDITAQCSKAGWQTTTAMIPSGFAPWFLGNFIFGGLIGMGTDVGTGAVNTYPKSFVVRMQPPPKS